MSDDESSVLIVSEDYARLRAALREAGMTTAGLPDAESARVIFDSLHPCLVISDVELTTSGKRTLPYFVHILSKHPHTPLLGIADRDFTQDEKPAAERFNLVLQRPVHIEDLLSAVKQLLH